MGDGGEDRRAVRVERIQPGEVADDGVGLLGQGP
jgi:hypothetical protein